MMLVDQGFASQPWNLPKSRHEFLAEAGLRHLWPLVDPGGNKAYAQTDFPDFEEHLVSLSFATHAVNTSLTPCRAHFPEPRIWPAVGWISAGQRGAELPAHFGACAGSATV